VWRGAGAPARDIFAFLDPLALTPPPPLPAQFASRARAVGPPPVVRRANLPR
jgi:hypothetical protein